jgi:hypothetical protein
MIKQPIRLLIHLFGKSLLFPVNETKNWKLNFRKVDDQEALITKWKFSLTEFDEAIKKDRRNNKHSRNSSQVIEMNKFVSSPSNKRLLQVSLDLFTKLVRYGTPADIMQLWRKIGEYPSIRTHPLVCGKFFEQFLATLRTPVFPIQSVIILAADALSFMSVLLKYQGDLDTYHRYHYLQFFIALAKAPLIHSSNLFSSITQEDLLTISKHATLLLERCSVCQPGLQLEEVDSYQFVRFIREIRSLIQKSTEPSTQSAGNTTLIMANGLFPLPIIVRQQLRVPSIPIVPPKSKIKTIAN